MDFNPNNTIVQLCIQGMDLEEKGAQAEAAQLFMQAWEQATNHFERFTAAFYVARHQNTVRDKLKWYETALEQAMKVDSPTMNGAIASVHRHLAQCFVDLNDANKAAEHRQLADSYSGKVYDEGPFYHGTKADLQTGDLLTPGRNSNYRAELVMNHIYFTGVINGAGLAAALAAGDGQERVYIVKPTGPFEHDPNVTDKKFPGNPTRSYRSTAPLIIVGEVTDRPKLPPEAIQQWKERLANNKGDIIN